MFSMIFDMARDGVLGFVMACLMVILFTTLAILLFILGYELINNVNTESETGQAVIVF